MKYQTPSIIEAESMYLGNFTPMESRCVASQDDLKGGDHVVVLYLTDVQAEGRIPLRIPYIVKAEKFQEYIDRFIEIIESKRQASTKAPAALPSSEVLAGVKSDTPPENSPEKPA